MRDSRDAALVGRTLGEIAAERGTTPAALMIDLSLEEDLDVHFLSASMGHEDPSRIGPMLANDLVHVGASDGGAHIQSFATYGDTGYLFSEFVRSGGHLSLEHAVKKITGDTAQIWGLPNRGLLAPGHGRRRRGVRPGDDRRAATSARRTTCPATACATCAARAGVDTVIVNGEVAWTAASGYTDARPGVIAS